MAEHASVVEIPAEAATDLTITAPIEGRAIPLSEVEDQTFAAEILGPGAAIAPESGPVVSPVDGEVIVAFPTGHAYGLRSASGVELLIHVGMDTVQLEGKHFSAKVKAGDKVLRGMPLVEVDWTAVGAAGYQTVTAETARVSVAIPEDWYVYSTLDEAEINEMATRTGADPAELKKATTFQDVVALSPGRDANNVQEIFNCALLAYEKEVVSEETMTDDVNKAGGTVIKYSTVETANGTGSYIIYSPADSPEYASSQLALPNPQGSMVRMNVYSGSTERTQELIDNIAASLR